MKQIELGLKKAYPGSFWGTAWQWDKYGRLRRHVACGLQCRLAVKAELLWGDIYE